MYIGVKHQIKDTEKFWNNAKENLPKLPDGYKLVTAVANKKGDNAFCLWECESVDKLKAFMEPLWGGALADNDFFEIDESTAVNLPKVAAEVK